MYKFKRNKYRGRGYGGLDYYFSREGLNLMIYGKAAACDLMMGRGERADLAVASGYKNCKGHISSKTA